MKEKSFELEALFREFFRSLKRESSRLLSENELTNSDYHYLRTVAVKKGIQASEIADELGVRRGYISALSKRLEEMKLITRSPLKSDGRGMLISLTPEGEKCYRSLDGKVRALLSKKIARLTEQEASSLLDLMKKLVQERDQE